MPICIGKASVDMGKTALSILKKSQKNILEGIIVVNKENFDTVSGFKCFKSGHPVPNKNGLIAAKYLEKKLNKLDDDCLILLFLSGGGSSLLPYPSADISLEEKNSDKQIFIRLWSKHKGNQYSTKAFIKNQRRQFFLKMSYPAKCYTFILSDVIGDDLSSIASGPTVPDNTSFQKDVKRILQKYKIWDKTPPAVINHINRGMNDSKLETPKKNSYLFNKVENTLVGSNNFCLQNVNQMCRSKKLFSKIWKTNVEGDVRYLARKFINDIKKEKLKKPVILISGGESTVKIKGNGKGGRNQRVCFTFY